MRASWSDFLRDISEIYPQNLSFHQSVNVVVTLVYSVGITLHFNVAKVTVYISAATAVSFEMA